MICPRRYSVIALVVANAGLVGAQTTPQWDQLRPGRIRARLARTVSSQTSAAITTLSSDVPIVTNGTRLGPIDPSGMDMFGSNVDIQGNVAVIGANAADNFLGAAYVFQRQSGTWAQQAKLIASDRNLFSEFGENVKIDGNTIAVGAPSDQNGTGAVYIFQNNAGVWTQQAKLVASDALEFSFFADSIALKEDVVVSGADVGFVPGVGFAGAAYVFRRSGGIWHEEAKLVDPFPVDGEGFGSGAAIIDKGTLAIGASSALAAGVVTFFLRTGDTWFAQSQLVPSSPEDGQFFGSDIGVSGNSIVVGAPFAATAGGVRTGAAYVYRQAGNTWREEARFAPSDSQARLFGTRVAISGTLAIAGAPFTDFALPQTGGSAWVFSKSGGIWSTQARLRAPDVTPRDNFGGYVAVDGTTVVVGAEEAPAPSGPQEGAAYVFNLGK